MEEKRKGQIQVIVGVILFYVLLGIGFWIKSNLGLEYAPSYQYIFVGAILLGLIIGLLSGILVLSGYYRITGKRVTNFTIISFEQGYSRVSVFLNRVYFSIIFTTLGYGRILGEFG